MDIRRAVLDSAVEICAGEGPDAVSMREVARRSGVSHQAPYHHFGDRAGIFAAIAEEGFDLLSDAMSDALSSEENPVSACFRAYVDLARSHPGHFRVMFRGDICGIATHETTYTAADRAYASLIEMVTRTLGPGASPEETAVWASAMWSTVHGFSTLLNDGPLVMKLPPGVEIERHIADVMQLATEMITARARAVTSGPATR